MIRELYAQAKREAATYRERLLAFAESLRPAPPSLEEVTADDSASDILTPQDEVLQAHGGGDFKIYERLILDSQVFTTMSSRRAEVIAREWHVEPGADDELSRLAAEDLDRQMRRIGWDRLTWKMLGGIIPGNGHGECMFSIEATGHVSLVAVLVRPASRFVFRKDGALMVKRQGSPVELPERKVWTFRAGSEHDDNPYGQGIGPILYWPVWFKKNGLRFWSIFLERFANPTPVATVPPGTTETERNKLLALLGSVINGGRIVVPRGVDIELVQAIRSSGGDFQAFVDSLDAMIAKIVLGQTMTTDDGASLSQAKVHHLVQQARAKADADMIDESWRMGPATWLTEWNYPGAAVPLIYRDFSVGTDLSARADLDTKLHQIGYRPRPEYIAETYGDNYDYVEPAPGPAPGPVGLGFAEPVPATHAAAVDLLEGGGWERVMGPQVAEIERLLGEVRHLEEFRVRLGELALDHPREMTEALARALFTARIAGNVDAEASDLDGAAGS